MLDVLNKKILLYPFVKTRFFSEEGTRSTTNEYLFLDGDKEAKILKSSGRFCLVEMEEKSKESHLFEKLKEFYRSSTPESFMAKVVSSFLNYKLSPIVYYENPQRTTSVFLEYVAKKQLGEARGVYELKSSVLQDKDKFQKTAFETACENSDIPTIEFLYDLSKGKVLLDLNSKGEKPFMSAFKKGQKDVMRCLSNLSQGEAVGQKNSKYEKTAFETACENSDISMIEFLYDLSKGRVLEEKNVCQRTMFQAACDKEQEPVMECLYKCSEGRVLQDKNPLGEPISIDLYRRGSLGSVKLLNKITKGAIFQDRDPRFNKNLLMIACERDRIDDIKTFYELGGEKLLEDKDRFGRTAFAEACQKSKMDVIKVLCDLGGKKILKEAKERDLVTVFIQACVTDRVDVVEVLYNLCGENVLQYKDYFGRTVSFSGPKVREFLKSKGFYTGNSRNNQGYNLQEAFSIILGSDKDPVSKSEVKRAYKKLALKWHPDKNPNNREVADPEFEKVSKAYATITKSYKWEELPE